MFGETIKENRGRGVFMYPDKHGAIWDKYEVMCNKQPGFIGTKQVNISDWSLEILQDPPGICKLSQTKREEKEKKGKEKRKKKAVWWEHGKKLNRHIALWIHGISGCRQTILQIMTLCALSSTPNSSPCSQWSNGPTELDRELCPSQVSCEPSAQQRLLWLCVCTGEKEAVRVWAWEVSMLICTIDYGCSLWYGLGLVHLALFQAVPRHG